MPTNGQSDLNLLQQIKRKLIGEPKNLKEASIFHKLSLIPILAWIGLGADGLSSSSYGPEEAFRALGNHTYLALFLALATAFTVFVISYAYSRIIEHFPYGGGGYIVATHTIGQTAGVISGSALLVDYVLTITVSLASCGDAIFSFLPAQYHMFKVPFVIVLIIFLVLINLRGVKESVTILIPIFLVFLATHVLLLGYGIGTHISNAGLIAQQFHGQIATDMQAIGLVGVLAIFLRAFSMGGGTYTGIEAVSNSMQVIRDPKVPNGKRTMLYMALSLAIMASGLIVCYLLFDIRPTQGRTMNAMLADGVFGAWPLGGVIALITIFSEGALLIVGAQAGFIGGPRIMGNMAIDLWLPRRFAALSERLTMQDGVLLMGISSLALLLYTHGSVSALVIMYSINVFLTFSLSQYGMINYYLKRRKRETSWKRYIMIHFLGFFLCLTILIVTLVVKFEEGGWMTLLITGCLITLCYIIRGHYRNVRKGARSLDDILMGMYLEGSKVNTDPCKPDDMTAVLLVGGYNGFGLHSFLSIFRTFPNVYKNFIFVSVGEIDSGSFKGVEEMEALKHYVEDGLKKYVNLARKLGFAADFRVDIGIDVVETATTLCQTVAGEYARSTVFAGQLIFQKQSLFQRFLHNETAFAIQRRLQWEGIAMMILPIRVMM
jgi:amino acid transporter